ncbi:hypothetical protein Prum_059170 [Phytohabitans rumicis]|uniref:DUF3558 domain-containing protein n=1 Tax=Phytohabitans rumicis TaxID=1076125 RepID=A0A6V8LHZ4_9ACTN|nr:hypothetical protein Prum_059170 [Phytohabitans rumicis]
MANAATEGPVPAATPLSPGVEPPKPGSWPGWPKFGSGDEVQQLRDLEGLGFPLTVPSSWTCVAAGSSEGFAKYNCGESPGQNPAIGGELTVRTCPLVCDEERRTAMRKSEEAWGLQWHRGSRLSAYAETDTIDGAPRYGLVLVAYYRTETDESVNRQVVLRMTAPVDRAAELQKIANYLRDTLFF